MAAVSEFEENQQLRKQPSQQQQAPIGNFQETTNGLDPGLGIAAKLSVKAKEPVEVPVSASAPVVVQVGHTGAPTISGSPSVGELDRLALYITKGDEFMRDVRKRTVIDVLRATASTDEELKVLVARVEEIVAIKIKTAEENSGVNRFLKMGFEKLTSLLGGD
jgi:hypothetical protein